MDRVEEPRSDDLLRAIVAALQEAGYTLVTRDQAGSTSRLQFCEAAPRLPGAPVHIQLTHVRDPAGPRLEFQIPGRTLAWYYPRVSLPEQAEVVVAVVTALRTP